MHGRTISITFTCLISKAYSWVKPARSGPTISHLFFTDDVLLFLKAKPSELRYAQAILLRFSRVSGQVINPLESAITSARKMPRNRQTELANFLQMKPMKLSDKYLGVHLFLICQKLRICSL